jgi:serine-type D-Ala-D-Ala carboxypeptidase/endopeptidase (penicillin-binding protein 4)
MGRRRHRRSIALALAGMSLTFVTASATATAAGAGMRTQVVVVNPPVTIVEPEVTTTTTATTTATTIDVAATTTTLPPTTTTIPMAVTTSTVVTTPDQTTSTTSLAPTTVPVVTTTSALSIVVPATTVASTTTKAPPVTKAPTTVKPGAVTVEELRARIEAKLATATAGASGVMVAIDGGAVIVERDADAPLIPASTQKIYVAGAALASLGVDGRFTTEVHATGPVVGAAEQGDLVLRSSGDPSFTSANLTALAKGVRAAGITSVTGSLVIDDAKFDRVLRVASWKPTFSPGESGWLSSFAIDENRRNDAVTIADPALANLARFRVALKGAGVTVIGVDKRGAVPAGSTVVSTKSSNPIADLVRYFMKKSNNTYAEFFTKQLGARTGEGSTAAGVRAIASYFDQLQVQRPVLQEDGSGLSLNNRSTARQQVRFLQKTLAGPTGDTMKTSLAVSCVDGTLKSRTCGTAAAGKVFAKSGSIDFVVALTGVTTTASGKSITFSFLLNKVKSARLARAAIDAALVEIVTSKV